MLNNEIEDEYFEWLYSFVDNRRFHRDISYRRLMIFLYNEPFRWTIPRDENRAIDGDNLKKRYAIEMGFDSGYFTDDLNNYCSVLEVIIALALRMEETIMDDPRIGNRTSQWVWEMIGSLGLSDMTDERFNEHHVYNIVRNFLNRNYYPDGRGSLFHIPNCQYDLRGTEIWIQMLWYLDTIT